MEDKNKIQLEVLKKVFLLLLEKLENSLGGSIELKSDFYWDISPNEIYQPYVEPNNLALGQLSDEWSTILELWETNKDPIPYDLKRISEIIKAISIENGTSF